MAGVAHFLASVWRAHTTRTPPVPPLPPLTPPLSPSAATCEPRQASARHSGSMSLLLPAPLFAWLSSHAEQHNLGSVHKSVRDLLMWGADVGGQELAWVLLRPADAHAKQLQRQLQASGFADLKRLMAEPAVKVETRLPPQLQRWLSQAVRDYGLKGPSDVLEAVARVAVELDAAGDVFESVDAGHDLPRSSADLYYDLGIRGFACARDAPACVSPPPAEEPKPPCAPPAPPLPHRPARFGRTRASTPPRRPWLSVAH